MNSVDNVAKVLRLFTPDRSVLSVTEVSQLLALPKSSSSRLLKAMAETGLLAATEQGAGYSVGNLIFETSRRHRAHSTLSVAADEALARIVKATGHTGYVAMLDRTDVLGLRMRPGSKPLRVVTSPGDRLPAFCSSTGRAMLARLDDDAVRAPLSRAVATAVAQCAAYDRRSPGCARDGAREGLVAGDRREPAGRRIHRRLRRGSRER